MDELKSKIAEKFGAKVRVRACGVLIENNKVLLIKHLGVGEDGFLWAPPGGGVEFGESIETTIIREFKEETTLVVSVNHFLFFNEFIKDKLHAIELFFSVNKEGGVLKKGSDPEINFDIISEVSFKSLEEIKKSSSTHYHSLFSKRNHLEKIFLNQ